MQVFADVLPLRGLPQESGRSGLPPLSEIRSAETQDQGAAFSSLLFEALKPPDPWREDLALPESVVPEDGFALGREERTQVDVLPFEGTNRDLQEGLAGPEKELEPYEEEELGVLSRQTGKQDSTTEGLSEAEAADKDKEVREKAGLGRELDRLVRSLRSVLRRLKKDGAEPDAKRADEAQKGMQALLDLLRGVLPKSRLETVEKAAFRAETVLSGLKRGEKGAQPEAVTKALGEFLDGIAALKDLVTGGRVGGRSERKALRKSRVLGRGEATDPVGVRLKGGHPRFEVRNQRINDPRNLRGMVRITRFPGRQTVGAGEPQAGGEKVLSNALPENAARPQVQAVKIGRESALMVQQNLSTRSSQAPKKAALAEPLPNARQIVEQIVTRARVTIKSGMTEMQVQLNPRNMGRVGMHFTLNSEGELTAKLMASNETVRQYLQDNLSGFSRDLAAAGVNVARIEVSADGPGRQFSRGGQNERAEDEWQVSAGPIRNRGSARAAEVRALRTPLSEGQLDILA